MTLSPEAVSILISIGGGLLMVADAALGLAIITGGPCE